MISTEAILLPMQLEQIKKLDGASEEELKQFAKDFESVFINKLLDEMKNTVVDWGEEKDGASEQIDSIFWSHLALDLADNGGFGMWKDIYQSLIPTEQNNGTDALLDKSI